MPGTHPVQLVVDDDLRRSRLTVFFRLVLVVPHLLWLGLWGIAIIFTAVANWLATLILGRSPTPLHGFLSEYVRCVTQVLAYLYLAANPYPGFFGERGYPVDVRIGPSQRQNRWSVLFRAILVLPATWIAGALSGSAIFTVNVLVGQFSLGLLGTCALLGWFAAIARARMPHGLRDAEAWTLGYGAQLWAYILLLTDRYPDSDPFALIPRPPVRSDPISLDLTDGLRRSRLTVFFRSLLTLPHLVWLSLWSILATIAALANWLATLVMGRSPAALHRFLARFVRYQAHVHSYLFLIANPFPGFAGTPGSYPLELIVEDPRRQSRWNVAFRPLLLIPALAIASAYNALLAIAAFLGWFAAILSGQMPRGLRNGGAQAIRYQAQANGYLFLLTDRYPYSGPSVRPEALSDASAAPLIQPTDPYYPPAATQGPLLPMPAAQPKPL